VALCIITSHDEEEKARVVRILFLADDHLDYVSDPLYIGLSRLLGNEHVVDYPYKTAFHDSECRPWYLIQRPGRRYSREETLDLLRDHAFDLVCLASFRQESLDECAQLYRNVPFPPMVFVDGEDRASIRHDVVGQYPIQVYFKRDYFWQRGSKFRDLGALAWTFRGNLRLFERTFPLPLSIVMEALPDFGGIRKEIDVSYRGRASHPSRVKAVEILSRMEGIKFSGGVYADPDDRKYKLKAGAFERLRTKVLDNGLALAADREKKQAPEAYYREIASSRIAVALRGGGLTPPPRYYEIVAMKTLLISDLPKAVIPNEFVDRCHAIYCKDDLSDLENLVRRYLREDAAREAIVNDGFTHLMKFHTCERRAEYFLDVCRRVL
jgi:Glycosyl transferases group 1